MQRRVFVRSGALALVTMGLSPSFLRRTAFATELPRGRKGKVLVCLFQRGAADALNVVVPHGERAYYRLRPNIGIARPSAGDPASALDLDGFFGLHPSLTSLERLYRDGLLAPIHAVGSPSATRSHFDAQDYMESATPGVKSTRDGWLNRYLQEVDEQPNPLRGVALTRQMPRALQGPASVVAMSSVASFDVHGDLAAKSSFESAYASAADQVLNGTAREAFDAMRTLSRQASGSRYRPASGVEYPRSPFGQALQEIASLAKADVGLEVAFAESTNWDHHVNQGAATGQMANRLDDFSRGVAALARDLGDRLADTVILTMSEFGRAVAENGSRGTDHGHGNAMLLIGGGVRGGTVYGHWPGLRPEQRFEGRDLAITTDFRDVFAEVVVRHLGATTETAARVFPGYRFQPGTFKGVLPG